MKKAANLWSYPFCVIYFVTRDYMTMLGRYQGSEEFISTFGIAFIQALALCAGAIVFVSFGSPTSAIRIGLQHAFVQHFPIALTVTIGCLFLIDRAILRSIDLAAANRRYHASSSSIRWLYRGLVLIGFLTIVAIMYGLRDNLFVAT